LRGGRWQERPQGLKSRGEPVTRKLALKKTPKQKQKKKKPKKKKTPRALSWGLF